MLFLAKLIAIKVTVFKHEMVSNRLEIEKHPYTKYFFISNNIQLLL